MIYRNGIFKTNVTKGVQFYNATGISPDTGYTISTHTVDTTGNINQTWVNHTAKTALELIPTPTPTVTPTHTHSPTPPQSPVPRSHRYPLPYTTTACVKAPPMIH